MKLASARQNYPAHAAQTTITAAAAIGLKAWQPIALLQFSMLRMWAHSLERFAGITKRRWMKPVEKPTNARL